MNCTWTALAETLMCPICIHTYTRGTRRLKNITIGVMQSWRKSIKFSTLGDAFIVELYDCEYVNIGNAFN